MRRASVLPLLLAAAAALAVLGTVARAEAPRAETFVVVGGSKAHLLPAADAVADADKFALPAVPVSIEAAAGLPAVIARLAPPYALTADDAERLGQLAASPPSADAAGAGTGAASKNNNKPPRAAVLLHLVGVPPEHAESLAERLGETLTALGAGVVRHLRVRDGAEPGADAAAALVRSGAALAAANADGASSSSSSSSPAARFRVLESPGVAELCGMDCLAHRLGGDVADGLRHAYGLDDAEMDEGEAPHETAERRALRAASAPGELLAGELASVLASLGALGAESADADSGGGGGDDAVHVYEATVAGMQLLRAADLAAIEREWRSGGAGGMPGAADDADARAHMAADAFLATLEAVHRAVAARHGGADEVVVQVSLLPETREVPAPAALAYGSAPAALALAGQAGGKAAAAAGSSGQAAAGALTPALLGGAEAAAMRAPYVAWKRNARRQLLQAAGAWDDADGRGGGGGSSAAGADRRPFGVSATYWGVAVVLVWAVAGAVYCLTHMPMAEDTLLFGAARRNKGD
jgi:hypothetical protein